MSTVSAATNVVILLGPPGSGKGSQAILLKENLKLPHISTGDLLRQNIADGTQLGSEAKSFMEKGDLVPDELIIDMLLARVSEADCEKGYILDGFPRTLKQAEAFGVRLGKDISVKAINFELDDATILERISGRVICRLCQAPYNPTYPPKVEGKCDVCSGELIQRKDDTVQVIKSRLQVYHTQTAPLIAYYQEKSHLHTIDCRKNKEEIYKQILSILDSGL